MKHTVLVLAMVCVLLSGCAVPGHPAQNAGSLVPQVVSVTSGNAAKAPVDEDADGLPDALVAGYYLSSEDPVHAYLQHKSIQKFFNMWLEYELGEEVQARWNYDTLAPVEFLDHEFQSIARPEKKYYTCTFTLDDGRCGYIIVGYGAVGPHISKWSLSETTPQLYDLRANSGQIAAALQETDIDLATATAKRVEWIDTEKNRGDRVILFTDAKGDRYICYFGGDDFTMEKQ